MKAILGIACLLLAGCTGSTLDAQEAQATYHPPEHALATLDAMRHNEAVQVETSMGTFEVTLYTGWMPLTTQRFLALVDSAFYDNTQIHRVVDDFVIQGGDPTGLGQGGSAETIPHEWHPDLQYVPGSMGMARQRELDSADSQWFITETEQTRLSDPNSTTAQEYGTYALFGQITRGFDVVQDIADEAVLDDPVGAPGPVTIQHRPVRPIIVESIARIDPMADPYDLPRWPVPLDNGIMLVTPLHFWAGHAHRIEVLLDAPADVQLQVQTGQDGQGIPIRPDEHDPRRHLAVVDLPAGPSTLVVHVDGKHYTHHVTAWQPPP